MQKWKNNKILYLLSVNYTRKSVKVFQKQIDCEKSLNIQMGVIHDFTLTKHEIMKCEHPIIHIHEGIQREIFEY